MDDDQERAPIPLRPDVATLDGATLRRLRRAAGLTQAALARRYGCAPSAISMWETGRRALHEEVAAGLLAAVEAAAAERAERRAFVARRAATLLAAAS